MLSSFIFLRKGQAQFPVWLFLTTRLIHERAGTVYCCTLTVHLEERKVEYVRTGERKASGTFPTWWHQSVHKDRHATQKGAKVNKAYLGRL